MAIVLTGSSAQCKPFERGREMGTKMSGRSSASSCYGIGFRC